MLMENKETIIKAIEEGNFKLSSASEQLRNDKDIVLAAVGRDYDYLEYASNELKSNKDFIMSLMDFILLKMKKEKEGLKEKAAGNVEVYDNYMLNYTNGIKYEIVELWRAISDNLRKDRDVILEAVKIGVPIKKLPYEFQNDKEIVLNSINFSYRFDAWALDENLLSDIDIAKALVENHYGNFIRVGKELRDNEELALIAVRGNGDNLEYVSSRLQNNKEIVLNAVKNSGGALYYASNELKNDKDIVLNAVKNSGGALYYASNELKNDREIVLSAVNNNGLALQYANFKLTNDKEIVLTAIKNNSEAYEYASKELQNDREVFLTIISNGYIPDNVNKEQYVSEILDLCIENENSLINVFKKIQIDLYKEVAEVTADFWLEKLRSDEEDRINDAKFSWNNFYSNQSIQQPKKTISEEQEKKFKKILSNYFIRQFTTNKYERQFILYPRDIADALKEAGITNTFYYQFDMLVKIGELRGSYPHNQILWSKFANDKKEEIVEEKETRHKR